MPQVGVDREPFRMSIQGAQQIRTHPHQHPRAAGSGVEPAEQLLATRLRCGLQCRQLRGRWFVAVRGHRAS